MRIRAFLLLLDVQHFPFSLPFYSSYNPPLRPWKTSTVRNLFSWTRRYFPCNFLRFNGLHLKGNFIHFMHSSKSIHIKVNNKKAATLDLVITYTSFLSFHMDKKPQHPMIKIMINQVQDTCSQKFKLLSLPWGLLGRDYSSLWSYLLQYFFLLICSGKDHPY